MSTRYSARPGLPRPQNGKPVSIWTDLLFLGGYIATPAGLAAIAPGLAAIAPGLAAIAPGLEPAPGCAAAAPPLPAARPIQSLRRARPLTRYLRGLA